MIQFLRNKSTTIYMIEDCNTIYFTDIRTQIIINPVLSGP